MSVKWKRIVAGVIDHGIGCFLASGFICIITLGRMQVNYLTLSLFFIIYITYMIYKDKVFKDASLGKKAMKIKIVHVSKNGSQEPIKWNFAVDFKRSLPLLIFHLEIIMIFVDGQRIGDVWAHTAVVER